MNDFFVLIPARLGSVRLANKMLLDLKGTPLVIRTAQRAQQSAAKKTLIATDSDEIAEKATAHGIPVVRTGKHHTGTDRLAEAAKKLGVADDAIIVNVQGDEPLIDPELINQVANQLCLDKEATMATAAAKLTNKTALLNPNTVKVVCNYQQRALYFSRAAIPWPRDYFELDQQKQKKIPPNTALQHIGIYAYRNHFLQKFTSLSVGHLERIESLEQLRALEHGYTISVYFYPNPPAPGVDTLEDFQKIKLLLE